VIFTDKIQGLFQNIGEVMFDSASCSLVQTVRGTQPLDRMGVSKTDENCSISGTWTVVVQ